MKKWEYHIVLETMDWYADQRDQFQNDMDEWLNGWGEDGWEVAATISTHVKVSSTVSPEATLTYMVFKRLIEEEEK